MVPESGSEILQVPSEKRAKEVVAWRKRQEDNLKAGFIFVCILLNTLVVQTVGRPQISRLKVKKSNWVILGKVGLPV